MRRTAAVSTLLAGIALALSAVSLPAQSSDAGVGGGVRLQELNFDDTADPGIDRLSLLTVPVAARARLADGLSLEVGGYWARGELTFGDGSKSTVAGWTDTRVTASYRFRGESSSVTVSAIGSLPTGLSSYDVGELAVAGAVSADLLPLTISNWGTGGGAGVRASASGDLGAVGAVVSVGYFRSGEFDPVPGELTAYRPGDNVSARAAMDVAVGSAGKLGFQVSGQIYGDDQLDGENLFRSGNRYEAIGNYSFPLADGTGFVYGGYHRREAGAHLSRLNPTTSQDILVTGGGVRMRVGSVLLQPTVDARLLSRGDAADGSGTNRLVRFGLRADWETGPLTVSPLLRGYVGSVAVRADRSTGFTGFDGGLRLSLGSE